MPAHSFLLSFCILPGPTGLSGGEAKSGGAKVCSRYSASRARSHSLPPTSFRLPPLLLLPSSTRMTLLWGAVSSFALWPHLLTLATEGAKRPCPLRERNIGLRTLPKLRRVHTLSMRSAKGYPSLLHPSLLLRQTPFPIIEHHKSHINMVAAGKMAWQGKGKDEKHSFVIFGRLSLGPSR